MITDKIYLYSNALSIMYRLIIQFFTFFSTSVFFWILSYHYSSLVAYSLSISPGNYRPCCNLSGIPYIRNKHMNMSIANEWYEYWKGSKKFHSNDTEVLYIDVSPIDSYLNQDVNICDSDTFLIMMFPVRTNLFEIRQLIRRAIPQGLIIQGKRVNRVFVIALEDNDRDGHKRIRQEKYTYGDIIISRHRDSYVNVSLSVWDGYIWIRDHCSSATFAGKFDPDGVFFLGNLMALLQQYPIKRFFGGRISNLAKFRRNSINITRTIYSVPYDYPGDRWFRYVSGAAKILSMDSIDYLVAGAVYEPYFMVADDAMTGYILDRIGIKPINMKQEHCPFMIKNVDCGGKYKNLSLIPHCLVCYNNIKSVEDYNNTLNYFGDLLYRDNLQERVNLNVTWKAYAC